MKITCNTASVVGDKRVEKSCTVELADDVLETKPDQIEPQAALKTIIQEVFDGIKS